MSAGPSLDTSPVQAWLDDAFSVIAALEGRALDDALVGVECVGRRMDALRSSVIGRAIETKRFKADGHRRAGRWVAAHTRAAAHDAAVSARVAQALGSLPHLRSAFDNGEVSFETVEIITRRFNDDRVVERLITDDERLAAFALGRSTDDLRNAMAGWDHLANRAGARGDHADAHRRRRVRVVRKGTEVSIHARLGAADGAVAEAVLGRFADAEFRADCEAAVDGELPRTADQRAADALMAAMRTADTWSSHEQRPCSTCGTPAPVPSGRREPLVNLIVDAETVRNWGTSTTPDVVDPDRLWKFASRTTNGHPVDVDDIVRAMIIGRVRVVVRNTAGLITHVGRRQRLFRGLRRDAVILQHPTCIWPGCTVPASRCEADHLHPHTEGGPTEVRNGGPLCDHHNRFKAARGYRTIRGPDGRWHVLRPDGTSITPDAPPGAARAIEFDHARVESHVPDLRVA